jgi:hypothetical protein
MMDAYERTADKENFEKFFKIVNKALMKMSRILNPTFFALQSRGKYTPDIYGGLSHPIPSLLPVVKLSTLDPESSEYKSLKTKVVRARNRVSDTLNDAIELAIDTVSRIENFLN